MTQLINLFMTWLCWRLSCDAFDNEHPNWGWAMLVTSAANAATFLVNAFGAPVL